nr:MAG TPA: hypothetical protein [Caudoviricetes sp.]
MNFFCYIYTFIKDYYFYISSYPISIDLLFSNKKEQLLYCS